LLVGIGFYFKINSLVKNMSPVKTGMVVDGIYAIKDSYVNMFLIKDSNQFIAIDAGNDVKTISAGLKELNIDPVSVTSVLLTHTDRDHVGALELFKNAKIYISKPESQMLNGQKHKFLFFNNSLGGRPHTLLDDQQVLTFTKRNVKGILTEGHTSGSMCYLVDNKYLFTGDIITLKSGKIDKSIEFFDMDHPLAVKSVSIITKLPDVQYIFTAHCGYSDNYQDAVKDWK
ncbi:MAG: MBL fold metallo-hydrolase, partial [Bacteroidota bacterium]